MKIYVQYNCIASGSVEKDYILMTQTSSVRIPAAAFSNNTVNPVIKVISSICPKKVTLLTN